MKRHGNISLKKFILIGFLFSLFISCKKEDNESFVKNFISVEYSSDTIPKIDEIIPDNLTGFIGKSIYLEDSVYNIHFEFQENVWDFSIWIPLAKFHSEGIYELGEEKVGTWINLVQYGGNDPYRYGIGLRSDWHKDESGHIELYNETKTSIRLKFNDVKLNNPNWNLSANISCDIELIKNYSY